MISENPPSHNEQEQPDSHPRPEPLTQPPTRESLNRFHKADLQKRCRELGLTKIWVTKDQLINMIIKNTSSPNTPDATLLATPPDDEPSRSDSEQVPHTSCLTPMPSVMKTTPARDEPLPCVGLPQPQRPDTCITHAPDITQQTLGEASGGCAHLPSSEASLLSAVADITPRTLPQASHDSSLIETLQQKTNASMDDLQPLPDDDGGSSPSHHNSLTDQQPPSAVTQRGAADIPESPASSWQLGSSESEERRVLELEKKIEIIFGKLEIKERRLLELEKKNETINGKLEIKESEVELLNTEVKTAFSTIETLMKRISELENKNNGQEVQQRLTPDVAPPHKCLLLSDTNTQRVRSLDLGENCSVKTISRANMDLLRSWVEQKMETAPSECIIQCGLYDIQNSTSPEHILDDLGSLISTLKEKNGNMKINVCQVIPVPEYEDLKEKIIIYNEYLLKWGATNGVNIVETAPEFTLGTGDIDDVYFAEENKRLLILNRLGVIKLLSAIRKQCPSFKLSLNWESIKNDFRRNNQTTHQKDSANVYPSTHSTLTHNNYNRNTRNPGLLPHPRTHTTSHPGHSLPSPHPPVNLPTHSPLQSTPWQHYKNITPESTHADSQHTYAAAMRRTPSSKTPVGAMLQSGKQWRGNRNTGTATQEYGDWWQGGGGGGAGVNTATASQGASRYRPTLPLHPTQSYSTHPAHHSLSTHNYTRYRQGCYNCGEYNHRQSSCRFDHQLKCALCHRFGHKERLCHYYSK